MMASQQHSCLPLHCAPVAAAGRYNGILRPLVCVAARPRPDSQRTAVNGCTPQALGPREPPSCRRMSRVPLRAQKLHGRRPLQAHTRKRPAREHHPDSKSPLRAQGPTPDAHARPAGVVQHIFSTRRVESGPWPCVSGEARAGVLLEARAGVGNAEVKDQAPAPGLIPQPYG